MRVSELKVGNFTRFGLTVKHTSLFDGMLMSMLVVDTLRSSKGRTS